MVQALVLLLGFVDLSLDFGQLDLVFIAEMAMAISSLLILLKVLVVLLCFYEPGAGRWVYIRTIQATGLLLHFYKPLIRLLDIPEEAPVYFPD